MEIVKVKFLKANKHLPERLIVTWKYHGKIERITRLIRDGHTHEQAAINLSNSVADYVNGRVIGSDRIGNEYYFIISRVSN